MTPAVPSERLAALLDYEKLAKLTKQASDDLKAKSQEIKVLDTAIAYKVDRLKELGLDLEQIEKSIKASQTRQVRELAQLDEDMVQRQGKLDALETDKEVLLSQIAEKRQTLKAMEQEIVNRRKYLAEQEATISEAIESGNGQLKALRYEVRGLEDDKVVVKGELYELQLSKSSLMDSIAAIRENLVHTRNECEAEQVVLSEELASLRGKVTTAKTTLKAIGKETDNKLHKLREKERSLQAKQSALNRQEAELKTARRRLEGLESLYGA